jgi:hypothetical protein
LTEKPAAERKVGTLLKECLGEVGNIGNAVLAVGIERDDYLGRLRQRVSDAGLQRRALTQIEGMTDDHRVCGARLFRGRIARAVIHHDDSIARPFDLGDDAGNDRAFVIGRDHHIYP